MVLSLVAAAIGLASCVLQPQEQAKGARIESLRTVAERTDFHETAHYQDVVGFLNELATRSKLVHLSDIGKTAEARAIPLAIIADPPVANADEARRSGKTVVLLVGGIHSGECDGKEALLALSRDLAIARDEESKKKRDARAKEGKESPAAGDGPQSGLLDHFILAVVPIYNPDGNERMDPKNRPGQVGPDTMGIRENGPPPKGLDLNRDFIKLEAPETRALVHFINEWDPSIVVDTHTTNGSFHRYILTYDTNKNPAGDAKLLDYCRGTLMPGIQSIAKERSGLDTFWYGNFEQDHTRWETYPDDPRFGINYVGLRNRIGVLTESYSYATYEQRIGAQYGFISAVLAYADDHRDEIRTMIREADSRASGDEGGRGRNGPRGPRGQRRSRSGPDSWRTPDTTEDPAPTTAGDEQTVGLAQPERAAKHPEQAPPAPKPDEIVLRSKLVPSPDKATIKGYVEEQRDGRTAPTKEPKDYETDLLVRFEPSLSVPKPKGYIMAPPGPKDPLSQAAFDRVVQTLQRHGVQVQETREDIELDAAAYQIDAVTKAVRTFQGHDLLSVKTSKHDASQWFPAGSVLVKTAQPLGALACYLLEPEAADGLATWNFFDEGLKIGEDFPIYRLEKWTPITSTPPPPLPEDRGPKKPLTFEAVFESDTAPNFNGSPIGGLIWLEDGTHFLQVKDNTLYSVEAATGHAEPFLDPKPIAAALEKIPTLKKEAESLARGPYYRLNKDRSAFLIDHGNDLYYCRVDGSSAVRLTSSPQREELASFSPDGQFVAFVRDNDLWVVDVATQHERALTTGGGELLRHGKADWVYYEEVFNRVQQTYWWSPDSSRIVYYEIDSTPIKQYTIVNDIPEGQAVERTLFPKVGQPNPTAKLKVVAAAGGDPADVDLSQYSPQDMLILNAGWFPDSSRIYCYISNRVQTYVDVLSAPATGGAPDRLFREETKAWVDTPPPPKFLKDNSFLFTSERSGYKHLYHYARDGRLLHQVTDGPWEARSVAEVDEKPGCVYFSATRDNPIAENLYRVKLDGSGLERLTPAGGSHRADVSPDGKLFIDSWSSADHPTRVALLKTDGSELVRTLDTNPVRDLDKYTLGSLEMVHIPTPDGFVMEGNILKPADFDPSKKYPVWFTTYGGPQAPTVFDSWNGRAWDQTLATKGIIVFRADPRSASGKGAVHAWPIYRQLGIHELEDITTAIKWLEQNPWVDASRIGMSGHSYGGFMTSFCLTHSDLFSAGIAGAPVTDWRDYDSVYTERYMLTPQDNLDGYNKTSVVRAAANLHGRLLLLHGLIDDNVHLQNSERLIQALQRANKQFELMLYPESRHGIGGRHYQRLMYEFITRTMGAPAEKPSEPASTSHANGR